MNNFINYLKVLIIPLGVTFLLPIILSGLNLLNLKTSSIIILVFMVISFLISGILVGKKVDKKGYINGLIFGIFASVLLFIISLLFKNHYGINTLIYYLVLIGSSTFGSMIGIQKKANE